jgi:hypothetical protein
MSEYQKNPAYKNINSSSMFYVEAVLSSSSLMNLPKLVKVSPLELPPSVEENVRLPPKNPGYKNVNSSSMKYVEPSKKTK